MRAADLKPLTSLRFFAAFAIVLLHAKLYARWEWLAPLELPLGQGVSFFFVLSGFILSHVYSARPAIGYGRFLQLRIARLWPVHVFTLLVAAAFVEPAAFDGVGIFSRPSTFLANITLTQSLFPYPAFLYSWNAVSWSLSTEMGFYLAFPLLLPLLPRYWPLFLTLPIALVAGVGYGMERLGTPLSGDNAYTFWMSSLLYAFPLARLPEFCLGMVTYLFWRRYIRHQRWHWLIWTGVELALLIAGWSWISHDYWVF